MKRLMVTGASGFLGSRVVRFYEGKYEIFAPVHGQMDITDADSVEAAFTSFRPDLVMHAAAVSDLDVCEKQPEMSWKINVDGSRNVAAAAFRFHAKCLLCSSDQVYFGKDLPADGGLHDEEEPLTPFNLYGKGKKKAEEECLLQNPECIVLRLSWMYDAKTVNRQEHGDFFRTMLSGLETSETLSYPVYDVRGITDVNEVISNLEKAWELSGGIYNFGSPNDKNTYETVLRMFQELNWDTGRLSKNEQAFSDNPRNISMGQKKINDNGIYFSTTLEGLVRNGRQGRHGKNGRNWEKKVLIGRG